MTEFVKGRVFTVAEVREAKDGQIQAKVSSSPRSPSSAPSVPIFSTTTMTNNLSTSTMTNPQVEGLIEGYQYCFRVKAVNLGSTVGLR